MTTLIRNTTLIIATLPSLGKREGPGVGCLELPLTQP